MSEPITSPATPSVLNVPNQLTMARIVLSLALFFFLVAGWYKTALVLFVITAGTDWLDGYWARKYAQITQLGRVMDPFADKLFICGTFVLLSAVPRLADGTLPSGIPAWMTVVVVGRELLVTSLRAFVEQQGGDFSAKWIGKWKMGLQCLAAIWSMVQLTYVDQATDAWRSAPSTWMTQGLTAVVWAMVALTLYSGVSYVRAAAGRFQES
ncbi:CDP-diacylglycerol--glycerol-3-phosphate 3-phosphatidyltransferase [Bythopirellula polymerisocia]|uniref:CDP-diacylglycerol--glycerol-3-phosphate 3-phosphatidyltransferase n=1 Tax=Bythopirellula polymerisocia TaxID=2528003 RepID=A0A5C6CNA7_9BACT|nr:CDP-diacylglycerol--glycerol-3-phosphate 3-phosphatidyltransferase [Bythopirellula polymerisocia]TWU25585.1 CDP-diacylglycerol--glycerol-3-phosphate 3-phosphatidyltransferase [Bythopirellula polymerisocia]